MNKEMKCGVAIALGLAGLLLSGFVLAMATPPQKPAPATSATANAVMLKADELRAAPDLKSAALARIEKGIRVRLLASQNGWSQISGVGKTGWVRVLSVSADARDSIEISDLGSLGKTPQGKVVGVAGVRGLDEENLRQASYNAAEIERLHGFAVSRAEAEQFARASELRVRAMSYIEAPGK
jgi:hypothetical protein